MLFNSWQYALFFPVVFGLYWGLSQKFRVPLLLIASYWFYMSWNVKYVFLILFTTCISYLAALFIERSRHKRLILTSALIACLGVLFIFKYFNFAAGILADFAAMFSLSLHPTTLNLLLPVGISFYTFQTLGYVIDVYRGKTRAERNFWVYAAFISYFPQLVAGPIERTNNLLPQIKAHHEFDYSQAVYGIKLMVWGFFKKLCIADVLAVYADKVFEDVYKFSSFSLFLAVLFFTMQVYCDFSGYSDIARGCSKMLGIELMENFRSPYLSASIREFWSRWHISLSTWFRDYVYIPLGGNRCGKIRHNVNLMITFIVSGLWHGANWTFVIWGAVHGLAQVIENAVLPRKSGGVLRIMGTFVFVMLAWVFFRAQNLTEAVYVFGHMFGGTAGDKLGMNRTAKIAALIPLLILFVNECISLRTDAIEFLSRKGFAVRWAAYFALGLMVIFFSPKDIAAEFVYFQF
ncbi:MAG: MBOAT family protein [Synergistaceae bacterium]|nr:MBOAT family protein [Synergistaceae bacterium]